MYLICAHMLTKNYSSKKWVLQLPATGWPRRQRQCNAMAARGLRTCARWTAERRGRHWFKRSRVGPVASGWVLLHRAGPTKLFFYYSNCCKFAKYETDASWSPKLAKHCKDVYKINRNNFWFGKKFKFQTEFELKNPGSKLSSNLAWIYLGFKQLWKNMVNSSKF
jgi:hypothetical protein